jgi:hypothetical protein
MRAVATILAALLGLLGLIFVVAASQGNATMRIVVGLVCLTSAAALIALVRLHPVKNETSYQLHLSGDVNLEKISCQQCGATLSSDSCRLAEGAVFVHCEFCGAEYQIEEAPKW